MRTIKITANDINEIDSNGIYHLFRNEIEKAFEVIDAQTLLTWDKEGETSNWSAKYWLDNESCQIEHTINNIEYILLEASDCYPFIILKAEYEKAYPKLRD